MIIVKKNLMFPQEKGKSYRLSKGEYNTMPKEIENNKMLEKYVSSGAIKGDVPKMKNTKKNAKTKSKEETKSLEKHSEDMPSI